LLLVDSRFAAGSEVISPMHTFLLEAELTSGSAAAGRIDQLEDTLTSGIEPVTFWIVCVYYKPMFQRDMSPLLFTV
jgi:hypothetical protein